MERIEVEQGFLAAHRYQPSAKLLTVEFRDGRTWTHSEVPPEVYDCMLEMHARANKFFNNPKHGVAQNEEQETAA